jgi:hypothetical protein
MKSSKITALIVYLTVILFVSAGLNYAQDKKIDLKKVPAKVTASFHKAYEIESIQGEKHIDLLLTESGKIAEIEETISTDELPANAVKNLEKKYKGLKIKRTEKVTAGKKITYELAIESGDHNYEVVLNSSGKLMEKAKMQEKDEKGEAGEKGESDESDDND